METVEKRKFRCPLNFEPFALIEGSVTSDPDTEVWLIKAPTDFTPESLMSHRIPLFGHKTQKVKGDGPPRFYHITAAPCEEPIPLRAFLPHPGASGHKISCAPPLQGIISIAETFKDPPALHPIPDRPRLQLPEGLQQRFCPFGATAPKRGQEIPETHTKKKKKSKKRRREEEASL
ncbi:DNA-directed RNA polymerase I subunit RPA34 [Discoglossus pictus]